MKWTQPCSAPPLTRSSQKPTTHRTASTTRPTGTRLCRANQGCRSLSGSCLLRSKQSSIRPPKMAISKTGTSTSSTTRISVERTCPTCGWYGPISTTGNYSVIWPASGTGTMSAAQCPATTTLRPRTHFKKPSFCRPSGWPRRGSSTPTSSTS